jgi:hypothetical protein
MSQGEVEKEIQVMFSSAGLMVEFAQCQNNPDRDQWDPGSGVFSDPANHNPGNFRYLVTAFRFDQVAVRINPGEQAKADYLLNQDSYRGFTSQPTNGEVKLEATRRFLENPDTLTSQVLACSVLTHDKPKTYQDATFGYVLQVPKQLIICAATTDTSSSSWIYKASGSDSALAPGPIDRTIQVDEFLRLLKQRYTEPLDAPGTLIAKCGATAHNEVNVLGSTSVGQRVRATAIFVKVTPSGHLVQPFYDGCVATGMDEIIQACAIRHNFPIIGIPDSAFTASKVKLSDWRP